MLEIIMILLGHDDGRGIVYIVIFLPYLLDHLDKMQLC